MVNFLLLRSSSLSVSLFRVLGINFIDFYCCQTQKEKRKESSFVVCIEIFSLFQLNSNALQFSRIGTNQVIRGEKPNENYIILRNCLFSRCRRFLLSLNSACTFTREIISHWIEYFLSFVSFAYSLSSINGNWNIVSMR